MTSNLDHLRIRHQELEKLAGVGVGDVFVGGAFRLSCWRSPHRFLSLLVSEILILGVIVIFCLPLSLLIARSLGMVTEAPDSMIRFLWVSLGCSLAIAVGWNGYMFYKTPHMSLLSNLLDEVDKHNEVIDAVEVLDELSSVQQSSISLINRHHVIEALHSTRESLIGAIATERILRKNRKFIARRQELFANVEQSLATLRTLDVSHEANEYGQLLNDALQIGISLQQELRNLRP